MIFDFDTRKSDSPLLHSVWRSRSERGGTFISTAVGQWEMVVTRQRDQLTLTLRGPETAASHAPVPEDAEFFGMVFKYGVYLPGLPKNELVDNEIHLRTSGKNTFLLQNTFSLLGSTWQFPTYENADTFVERLVRAGILAFDAVVEDALRGQAVDVSQRSLQRRMAHVTGLTHKTIQQIHRARQASTLLQRGRPIIETAYETGYFDQAHLTNALKRFYGQTPAEIIRQAQFHNGVFFQDEGDLDEYNQINNVEKENLLR